jgi:hypothetical protein
MKSGDVAQLEERCLRKAEVGGSIPLISTKSSLTTGIEHWESFTVINNSLKSNRKLVELAG